MLGPIRAATTLTTLLARPVAGVLLVHRGALWARRRLTGAARNLHRLQSGILEHQLKALESILAGALRNARFRREFCRQVQPRGCAKSIPDQSLGCEANLRGCNYIVFLFTSESRVSMCWSSYWLRFWHLRLARQLSPVSFLLVQDLQSPRLLLLPLPPPLC